VKVQAIRFVGTAGAYTGIEKVGSAATSSSSGAFSIATLPPGDYTLFFDPADDNYGSSYLGGASHSDAASIFTVNSGASVTGKNITLVGSASVHGTYTDGSNPIENVRVTISGYTTDPDILDLLQTTFTDAAGNYSFTGLVAGQYTLTFGSFSDADPSDGIAENTDYRRRTAGVALTTGNDVTFNRTTSLRGVLAATAPPTVSSPEWKVGVFIASSDATWNANSGTVNTGTKYSWHRDGVPIAGATSWSYTPGPGDYGHTLTFVEDRYDWEYGYATSESAATDTIGQGDAPALRAGSTPNIGGVTPHVGDVLSFDTGEWEALGSPSDTDLGITWEIYWERSNNGTDWTLIDSGLTHTVTASDFTSGPRLRVSMRGALYGYADVHYDFEAIPWVLAGTFTNTKLPTVKTTSSTYSVYSNGSWSPTPTSYAYAWKIYDETLNLVDTQTSSSITRASVSGKYVELTVTPSAPNVTGTGVTIIVQTGKIHTTTSLNSITGDPRVGEVLTAPAYSWSPSADSTTYKWQYYTGKSWKSISGATASTYQVTYKYKSKKLRVVTYVATPGFSSSYKASSSTSSVKTGFAPVETVTPSFTGDVGVKRAVTVDPGTWSPSATSYSYQWRYRTTEFGAPKSISGATKSTYTISSSYVNKYLDVKITIKRSGHTSATSVVDLGVILPSLSNVTKPTVTTTTVPDPGNGDPFGTLHTVTANGTWSSTPTSYTYAWQIITTDGSTGIYGVNPEFYSDNSAFYRPVDVVVTAYKNGYAPQSVTVPAKDGIFQISGIPTIDTGGSPKVGSTFTGFDASASNLPDWHVKKIQWQVFSAGEWKAISGATSSTFIPSGIFAGQDVRYQTSYTAARYATVTVASNPVTVSTGTIISDTPASTTDSAAVGSKITYSAPIWITSGVTTTYVWQSSTAQYGTYTDIPGATSTAYTPKETDLGMWVRLQYAGSKLGYSTYDSVVVGKLVQQGTVSNTSAPKVSRSGYTLTVTAGSWSLSGLTSTSYEWRRYTADASSYSVIGTNSPSYSLVPADDGRLITVAVTVAKAPAWGNSTAVAVAQSGGIVTPSGELTITGGTDVGNTLTLNIPGWQQSSPIVGAQWYRSGKAIAGDTGLSHTVVSADLGKKLTVKVTASLAGFSSYVVTLSAGTGSSATIPVNLTAPVVSPLGQAAVDTTLTTSTGTWSVSSMSYKYQWYRGASAIAGATSSSYTPSVADIGSAVRVLVTASKAGYVSATAYSETHTVVEGSSASPSGPITLSLSSGKIVPNTITWDMPVTVTYQWLLSTNSGADYAAINGATASSLALASLTTGDYIVLQVTATRLGHGTTVVTSAVEYVVP
jgi:hypothetical protein